MGGKDLADERRAFVGEFQPLTGEEVLKAVDFALYNGHGRLVETESQ